MKPLEYDLRRPQQLEPLGGTPLIVGDNEVAQLITQAQTDNPLLTTASISGLCGGGKSTLAKSIQRLVLENDPNCGFPSIEWDGERMDILPLDAVMSVSRGNEKKNFVETATTEMVKAHFFRSMEIARIIRSLVIDNNDRHYELNEAYSPKNGGQKNGSLSVKKRKGKTLLLAEGVTAKSALQNALDESSLSDAVIGQVHIALYTDPSIAVLNTVKRACENPERAKDPVVCFEEFRRLNNLIIPALLSPSRPYHATKLNPELDAALFKGVFDFFKKPAFNGLIERFIEIIRNEINESNGVGSLDVICNSYLLNTLELLKSIISSEIQPPHPVH